MNPKKSLLLWTVSTLVYLGLSAPEVCRAENIKIGGSGFGLGVMKILAGAYEKAHPGVRIEVVPSLGSAGGIKALNQGALDISISGRPPTAAEAASGLIAEEIARSPFVFITNKGVSKEGVTTQELEKIYRGQTLVWPDGTRIRPVLRPESDTVTKIVRGISPAMNQAMSLAMSREGMIRAITDQESADVTEKTAGALESGTLTQVNSEKRQVNVLSYNGIKPGVKSLADGSYPLYTPMFLVIAPKISPAALKFVEFVRSGAGSAILTNNGNLVVKTKKGDRQ